MPAVPNPVETAELIRKNDELTAKLNESLAGLAAMLVSRDEAIDKLATAALDLVEAQAVGAALRTENEALKDRLAVSEKQVEDDIELVRISDDRADEAERSLEASEGVIRDQDARIAELSKAVDASVEAAVEAEETSEAVRDQLANLAGHLVVKGAAPDIDVVGAGVSSVYQNWMKLSASGEPTDKIAARRMYASNRAEIDAEIQKHSGVKTASVASAGSSPSGQITPEDRAVYEQWQQMRREASLVLAPFSAITPVESQRRHTELTVEARKLYNRNRATIERCITAEAAQPAA